MSESENKNSFFANENVLNLLKAKPLGEFLRRNLSIAEIDEKLFCFNDDDDDELESDFDRLVNLIIRAITEAFDKINLIINDEGLIDSHQFPSVRVLLVYLREYSNQIERMLKETDSKKHMKKKMIGNIEREIAKHETENAKLLMKLKKLENSEPRERFKFMTEEIKELLKEAQEKNQAVKNEIKSAKFKAYQKLQKSQRIHRANMKNFTELEKVQKEILKTTHDNRLTNQKKQAEQKLKAEQKLATILLKFDNDIGSRAHEIEAIEGEIDAEKKKFELWKSTICARQEVEYTRLMEEREEEEARERAEKFEKIRREHAAKVIQAGWRKYEIKRKTKLMKQRKKKIKKGKK